MDLNNRELASVIWLVIVALLIWSKPDLRSGFGPLFRSFLAPAIWIPLLAFSGYITAWVLLADQIGLWQSDLINDTIVWFLASGAVLFFSPNHVLKQPDFFRRTIKKTLAVGIAIEVFVNLVVLPLPIELILLPVVTFLVLLGAVAEGQDKDGPVKKIVDGVLIWIGLTIFSYVALKLMTDPGQISVSEGLQTFALPVWLALVSLPFIYAFGLIAAYQKAFNMIRFFGREKLAIRRARISVFKGLGFRLTSVAAFNGPWQKEAARSEDPNSVVERFKRELRELRRLPPPAPSS